MPRPKLLIVGASGLCGTAVVSNFIGQDEWDIVGVSRNVPPVKRGTFVSVDLYDRQRCNEVFGQMSDITHVAFVALAEEDYGGVDKFDVTARWTHDEYLNRNLALLTNMFDPLEAAARNLERILITQGGRAYGVHIAPMRIPGLERMPRHPHRNFYWLQEDYLRAKQVGKSWSYVVLRPRGPQGAGFATNTAAVLAIGVYGAIQRERGLPLAYPGGPPYILEMTDADLFGRSVQWSLTTPACANETFNISNGDVFVWRNVWPTIAAALGMDLGPDQPICLEDAMPKYKDEWAKIVQKYDLLAPPDLDFLGRSFAVADYFMAYHFKDPAPMIVSTIKARQFGFTDCMDTEDMFTKLFRRFQDLRLLPPVG